MSETKPLRLYSKSSVETDWGCERKFYLNYCHGGKGIVSTNTSLELFMGAAIHDSLATIAFCVQAEQPVDIDLIATTAYSQMYDNLFEMVKDEPDASDWCKEQATLVEGMIRGFYKHVWPGLIEKYPIVKLVEQAMVYIHDGVGMMVKPDLVLADEDGENVYIEYKSTSSKKVEWVNSWNTAVQVHSSVKAISDFLGEDCSRVIVQGLYKGYESYGKQSSPFCYAYKRSGNPPFTEEQISYEYKPGFKRFPVWELDGGVKKWVEEMPENVLADQFPQTPPMFVNEELIQAFFRQRATREAEVEFALDAMANEDIGPEEREQVMDQVFPQRFNQCYQSWGRPCNYVKVCHGPAGFDPLSNGYVLRSDEHQQAFRDIVEQIQELQQTEALALTATDQ